MRFAVFTLAVLFGCCAANASQIEVLSSNPKRIEIAAWCWTGGSYCQQEASDFAQGICHGIFEDAPRRAVYVRSERAESSFGSERVIFVYKCDRQAITCQAGNC